ncbi:carbonic anhydrase [Methyloterricola oryzae]|uniref:carbonic anhydrase n=1 Tax=Methyloterricola oryzae TaxID=1495050 RepID=UPI0005EB6616|nr:carbonic anhydrase [Methyloterricola oryzae]
MKSIERLLLENKAWAQEKLEQDPNFLDHLRQDRKCKVFWIGCSDSRVHADEITNSEPGEILVHRNTGNQVSHSDFNLLGALEYAVNILEVEHVIVCGHYRCKGVRAAMNKPNPNLFFANKWLKNIKDVYRLHRREIDAEESEEGRWGRLVEVNVIEQAHNLAHSAIIQKSWIKSRLPLIHGWIYGLHDGIIKELITLTPEMQLDPLYQYDLE